MVLWENHGNIWGYPLVICSIAIEDCHLCIVNLPIEDGGSFQFAMGQFTRG